MRFGPTPIPELEGAVLAHTLHLADGVLKKGHILGSDDADRIARAGLSSVVAAVLEPGDLYEDQAATRMASAVAGAGLWVGPASTGRANVFAAHDGLVAVDERVVRELNGVDPALTLATALNGVAVRADDLVATAKVIPLGVAGEVVETWEAKAADSPALALAPFRPHRVGLVLTRFERTPGRALENAETALGARVEGCGSVLERTLTVSHDVAAVSGALRQLGAEGLSPLLVLGASQIADVQDVVPAAITLLGGRIHRVGIPVDPGNLLLWAELDGTTVLGVPGCARAKARSGFDSVLERVLAGLELDQGFLRGLGYGGLLKEISARGHPRLGRAQRDGSPKVAGILLAAGSSTRMGQANKLLEPVTGHPMVRSAASVLLEGGLDPVVVVTGHGDAAIREALSGLAVQIVHNHRHEQGMSTSVIAGLDALVSEDRTSGRDVDGAVIALADMPWVRVDDVRALVAVFADVGRGGVCVPVHERKRGNPVLWGATHFGSMRALRGDAGAKTILAQSEASIVEVSIEHDGILRDVDTPEALEAARKEWQP